MKRLPDWRVRLAAALDAIERTPLDYGYHDCAVGLAAGAVEAVLGVDMADRFRGRYRTAEEALAILLEERASSLHELVGRFLPAMPIGDMRLGDIAAIFDDSRLGCFLAVCSGERLIVVRPDGKGTIDRSRASLAFRVGS